MKVIFHIDEESKWETLLSNVHHLRQYFDEVNDGQIEVLVNGEAVQSAIKNSFHDLSVLTKQAHVAVCNNSLEARSIRPADLQEGVETVPSGVVELALKQADGYAYIKP
ncbi:DsrE family protein [Lactococcus fujiensis]|uniref:Uncharacterized protein n=1 Tax=Lactococcus fujiensis JCM 16395 TaxID=1291764 RepID=A0A2A5RQ71_9LACT|nr:DsrE family protein [Lactococcus fujiensis]PCS01600.1 hypothetical protein RT41_GL000364 [Lactococcus fujiensis JCM 16395]